MTDQPKPDRQDGYYGCSLPPGACGCPQASRHKCSHRGNWIATTTTRDAAEGADATQAQRAAMMFARSDAAATPQPAPDAVRIALSDGLSLINRAFGELVVGAMPHVPEAEKIKFEANFFAPAREWLKQANAVLSAPVPPADGANAQDFWHELVEKTDRTSPEEYPEMALITFEELCDFTRRATSPSATGAAEPVAFDPSNHHNALKCPYCNPQGLSFATPPVRGDREAIARAIFKSRLKVGGQTADVYFSRRANHPHAIDDSTMAVDAAFRDADALIAAGLILPVQPGAGERDLPSDLSDGLPHLNRNE